MQIFLVLDDDHRFLAGGFVHFLLHRDALDDVVELHAAGFLGKNRHIVRVPLDEGLAFFDLAAIADGNHRADHDVVILQLAAVIAENGNRTVLIEHDIIAVL